VLWGEPLDTGLHDHFDIWGHFEGHIARRLVQFPAVGGSGDEAACNQVLEKGFGVERIAAALLENQPRQRKIGSMPRFGDHHGN